MKLESKPTTVTTSTCFKETEFGIKEADMGLILEILRSKLYSNPIGAICREVASNSRDANREAENNVPIEISINNSVLSMSDMTISFKDFGHGISPKRMAGVFVNYGSSTKRESDEFTGGFGLGAKTPFSYADNFTIETIVDGFKYIYVAAIEEGSKGKIYCIDKCESVDASGTTIIVPIKSCDRSTFESEVYKATVFWPMQPVYKNFSKKLEDMKLISVINTDDILVVEQNLMSSGYGLLLDGIYYPINTSIMSFSSQYVYGHSIIFKFNVGELTISANRETLQYDDKTKTAINKRFIELKNLCKAEYEALYKSNTSWLNAVLSKSSISSNIYWRIIKDHLSKTDPFLLMINKFDDRILNLRLDRNFQTLEFFRVEHDHRGKVSRTKFLDVNEDIKECPCFLFDQTMSYISSKDATIFLKDKKYIAIRPTNIKYLKFSSLTFKEKKGLAKGMRIFLQDIELLGKLGISYSLYSTVDRLKVSKDATIRTPTIRQSNTLKVYIQPIKEYRYGRHANNSTHVEIKNETVQLRSGTPLEKKDYVLILVDDLLQLPNLRNNEFEMLQIAVKAGLIPDFSIIFANKTRGLKLKEFFTPLEEKQKLLTPEIITQLIDASHAKRILDDNEWILKVSFKSKKFSELVTNLLPFEATIKKDYYVPDYLQESYKNMSQVATYASLAKDIYKTFPLIPLINTLRSYSMKHDLKDITQYINLMETDLINDKKLI